MTDGKGGIASIAAMFEARKIAAAAALVAALALSACGSDDEPEPSIPRENAEALVATLDEIRDNVDVGSCTIATGKVQELEGEIDELPSDVEDEVRDGLNRGAQHLLGLVDEQCDEEEPATTTEEEPTTTEETTETEPAEPTEPTETTETTETAPPDEQPPGQQPGQGPGGTGGLGPAAGGQ
jgi:hypothetical protein